MSIFFFSYTRNDILLYHNFLIQKIKIFSDKQFIMIKSRFLLATFVGIFVYTLVSFIAGRNGVICYTQLFQPRTFLMVEISQPFQEDL